MDVEAWQAIVHEIAKNGTRLSKFTLIQTMVEVMQILVTFFKRSHACTATFSASNPEAGHHPPRLRWRLLDIPGHSWVSLGQSLLGSLLFSWVLVHTRFFLCPPRVYFPVLCKFWELYDGVNCDLLQEGLFHKP